MIVSTCEHGNDPDCLRCEIIDAKTHLYHLIWKFPHDQWTEDDRRIGMALVVDSEFQALLDKPSRSETGMFDSHDAALHELEQARKQLQAADELAKAAKPLLEAFDRMRADHHSKLVEGQTLESASENWNSLVQEPLEFRPLIEALAAYEKVRKGDL